MKPLPLPLVAVLAILVLNTVDVTTAAAKKPSRSRSSATSGGRRRPPTDTAGPSGSRPRVSQRRKPVYEDEEDDIDDFGGPAGLDEDEDEEEEMFDEEEEEEEDEEEEYYEPRPKSRKPPPSSSRRPPPTSRTSREAALKASNPRSRRPPQNRPPPRYEDDDDYEDHSPTKSRGRPSSSGNSRQRGPGPRPGSRPGRPLPPRKSAPGRRPGSVVPYTRHQQPSVFARSLDAIKSNMPDPNTIREVANNSLNAARATTSSLSANIYREIKGLTSSELEQVLLKSTRPDDGAVKGKHVERLVGVTYQISSRYDIYDAVLRKLWSKMAEKDWRTKVKALYILHRFSADGSPEHAAALKARLRELRRTRDPKRKDKYFNSKQLLAGESKPETVKYRAFMSRYAHYVILRAQCFGGMFDEISAEPKVDKKQRKPPKPITNTALRAEHLEAAAMLFKAGLACQLKDGEECENTAIAAERVASDMIGLTSAVAMALNRVLKTDDLKGGDPALVKKWCELYKKQLLPQTRAMVKKLSGKLDAYGLFLPSRMGTSVSQELLERGLNLEEETETQAEEEPQLDEEEEAPEAEAGDVQQDDPDEDVEEDEEQDDDEEEDEEEEEERDAPAPAKKRPSRQQEEEEMDEEEELDQDEYEYEEEEYYDDEEE